MYNPNTSKEESILKGAFIKMLRLFGNSSTTVAEMEKSDTQLLSRIMDKDNAQEHAEKLMYFIALKKGLENAKSPKADINAASAAITQVRKILRSIDAGFSFCNPPANWYCGTYDLKTYEQPFFEDFPRARSREEIDEQKRLGSSRIVRGQTFTFRGIVPPAVQPHWRIASEIFGKSEIRIYSPNAEDFTRPVVVIDPLMIGRVVSEGTIYYFRIAHWDLEKDLENFLKTGSKMAE